jgi:hypothetical protein
VVWETVRLFKDAAIIGFVLSYFLDTGLENIDKALNAYKQVRKLHGEFLFSLLAVIMSSYDCAYFSLHPSTITAPFATPFPQCNRMTNI